MTDQQASGENQHYLQVFGMFFAYTLYENKGRN